MSRLLTFLVEGGLLTEERHVFDMKVFEDPMSGYDLYKTWVRSNRPEIWTRLFRP